MKELEKKAEDLKPAREDVERLVCAARNNNEEMRKTFQVWMNKVELITGQAEKFSEEKRHANIGCSHGSRLNLWLRYNVSKEAKKMAIEAKQLKVDRFERVSTHQTLP